MTKLPRNWITCQHGIRVKRCCDDCHRKYLGIATQVALNSRQAKRSASMVEFRAKREEAKRMKAEGVSLDSIAVLMSISLPTLESWLRTGGRPVRTTTKEKPCQTSPDVQ